MARNDLRTPEIIEDMKQMRINGATFKNISLKYKCSISLVRTLIEKPIQMKKDNMVGKIYNTVEILRRATKEETPWKSHSIPYLAHCKKCDITWIIRKEDIGKDCPYCKGVGRGHMNKSYIGQRFGLLTVLDVYSKKIPCGAIETWFHCKCACGNFYDTAKRHVITGRKHADGHISYTISCGCASRSLGEINTEYAIKELGYDFNREIRIKDCHAYSPFDIEMIDPKTKQRICFFECDGQQHYDIIDHFHMTEETLQHQKETDQIKDEWCKKNNIPLFRIPYIDYKKINSQYLLNRFPELKELLEREGTRQKGIRGFN